MLRIAYLIDCLTPPIGGTEHQLFTAIRRMDPERFSTTLFTLQHDSFIDSLDVPCQIHPLGFRSLVGPDLITCGRTFMKYCRENHIDIVQTFFRDSNIVGTLWAKAAGVDTVIASRRNIGTGYWHTAKELWMLRRLARFTDHYIANSAAAARETHEKEGVLSERISVLPNCLDPALYGMADESVIQSTRDEWGFPVDAFVVGSVSNLRRIKNPGLLLEVASVLCPRFPQLRFVILGEGNMRAHLEGRIRDYGLEGYFVLPGTSVRIHEKIQAFDVAVLTSWGESSPNAVLEYMAGGKAHIVSDVGGNGELVEHGRTGLLFDPAQADQLASAIEKLIVYPALRQRMGVAARGRAEARHSCNVVIPQLEQIYESVSNVRLSP